eukprot:jgi/Psemu1/199515/e_gw1.239.7.1
MTSVTDGQQQIEEVEEEEQQQQQQQLLLLQKRDALPLHFQSATVLASKIRSGEISSLELTRHFIRRIEELDRRDTVNAVVVRCFDAALDRARDLDRILQQQKQQQPRQRAVVGPLHGVPITVKENNDVRHLRTTLGNPTHQHQPPRADRHSPAVQRLVDAGAVILGKTNLPLSCNDVQTYNAVWGATSNPHDRPAFARTAGGSSGGSAAALSAGFCALELGGDIGGSIRVPAALCGVFGHKPTLGAIPFAWGPSRTPDIVAKGPMARTAHDLEVALNVLVGVGPEGPAKRAWTLALPPPARSSMKQQRLADFRVALWEDDPRCPVDSDVRAAMGELRERLLLRRDTATTTTTTATTTTIKAIGCVEDDRPLRGKYGWEGGSARAFDVYKCLLAAEENLELDEDAIDTARNALLRHRHQHEDEDEDHHTPSSEGERQQQKQQHRARLHQQAKWITQSTQSWHRANQARQEMRAAYERFFETYDVLVCPVTVCAAWTKDETGAGPHEWAEHEQCVRTGCGDGDDESDDGKRVQHFWQIGNRVLRGANGHTVPYHDQVFWSGVTNVCGNPSTAFPAGRSASTGLPIGLQVVGAEWMDLTTIAFAKALEQEAGYGFVPPEGF